jgi:hypothetical protein
LLEILVAERLSVQAVDFLTYPHAVVRMPKRKSTSAGPMTMQPLERGSMAPTQGLPIMPGMGKAAKTPRPQQQPTRMEAVRAAKAGITRRKSLQKQRRAQKDNIRP